MSLSEIKAANEQIGALNWELAPYAFISEGVFLTKAGDIGCVLKVRGIDYEGLEQAEIDSLVQRLQAALRGLGTGIRVYQYLFRKGGATIPSAVYENSKVNAEIESRIRFLAGLNLYTAEMYYVLLCQDYRYKLGFWQAVRRNKLLVYFSLRKQYELEVREIEAAESELRNRAATFISQVEHLISAELCGSEEAFRVMRKTLNPEPSDSVRLNGNDRLDYRLGDSSIREEGDHLRVGKHFVKTLTLKELPERTRPMVFEKLLHLEADYIVCVEWMPIDSATARKSFKGAKSHYEKTKEGLQKTVDNAKLARIADLGEAQERIEAGQIMGDLSLTVVLYGLTLDAVNKSVSQVHDIFNQHDARLYTEEPDVNLLLSYLACVPGNYGNNSRYQKLFDPEYADLSLAFALSTGTLENAHLRSEYTSVLETEHKTPYFLSSHYRDIGHQFWLGSTGAGKSFRANQFLSDLQKYDPAQVLILDMGGSYKRLTEHWGGSYVEIGRFSGATPTLGFSINPFACESSKANMDFLADWVRSLLEQSGPPLTDKEQDKVYWEVENLMLGSDPEHRYLGELAGNLGVALKPRLGKWVHGANAWLFNNREDTFTLAKWQCIDLQGFYDYPDLLKPFLRYVLHREEDVVLNPATRSRLKLMLIDEGWAFTDAAYLRKALKTRRKHNGMVILVTQSGVDLEQSGILPVILECCPTRVFFSSPGIQREWYERTFGLNPEKVRRIAELRPKEQFAVDRPDGFKILNLHVGPEEYQRFTSDPMDLAEVSHANTDSVPSGVVL